MKINNSTKKKAIKYLKQEYRRIIFLIFIILLGISINSFIPVLYGQVFDNIISGNLAFLKKNLVLYLILLLAVSAFSYIETVLAQTTIKKIDFFYQHRILFHLLRSRLENIEQIDHGCLVSNITWDIQAIVTYIIEFLTSIIYAGLNLIIPLAFILKINVKLAMVSLIFIPLQILVFYIYKDRKKSVSRFLRVLGDRHTSFLISCIYNITSVKSFRLEKKIGDKFTELLGKIYNSEKQKTILDSKPQFIDEMFQSILIVLLILMATKLIDEKVITIGVFTTFTIYSSRLYESINIIQKLQFDEQSVAIAIERLEKLQSLPLEKYESQKKCKTIKDLSLINVSFAYQNFENQTVLQNINIELLEKGFYSIVGKNGSGKTTLIKLIMGLYEPIKGEIYVNGIAYKNLSAEELRKNITYIQKEPFILNDSIYNNLTMYGEYSKSEIWSACGKVDLIEDIKVMPSGLNTMLSDNVDILSSGMKQKLSFARAILHPSDIMIFDEITSDLDGKIEKKLVNIITELSKNHIVISVSHRINTVKQSDKIFLLKNGEITAIGKFENLIEINEDFRQLFK